MSVKLPIRSRCLSPNSVNKQEIVSPNDQADPQPGQRTLKNKGNTMKTQNEKTETLTAVGSSALFGDWDVLRLTLTQKEKVISDVTFRAKYLNDERREHILENSIKRLLIGCGLAEASSKVKITLNP